MRSGESSIEQRPDTFVLSKQFQMEQRNAREKGVRGRVKLPRRNVECFEGKMGKEGEGQCFGSRWPLTRISVCAK